MKRIFKTIYAAAMIVSAALFVVSCEQQQKIEPVFELNEQTVNVPAEGGEMKVTYSLENPVDGVQILPTTTSEWISDLADSGNGEITFSVAANLETAEREAVVDVVYEDIKKSFTVIQAAYLAPEINVEQESVDIAAEGGSLTVDYVITNAKDGIEVSASSNESWVNGFDFSVDGKITFNVDASEVEEVRTAVVTVSYGDANDTFEVEQEAADFSVDMTFEFNIKTIEAYSVVADVTPSNKEATYIYMAVDKAYFDGFEDDEAYFQDDLEYFAMLAEGAGMTIEELLRESLLVNGDVVDANISNLDPETGYYLYAYGLLENAKRTTDIFKQEFTTISDAPAEPELTIVYDKYFYVDDELIAMYPDDSELKSKKGKLMVPITFEPSDPSMTVYSTYYSSDWSGETADAIESAVTSDIYSGWATTGTYVRFFLSPGPYSILAYMKDSEGNIYDPKAVYLGSISENDAAAPGDYVPKSAGKGAKVNNGVNMHLRNIR